MPHPRRLRAAWTAAVLTLAAAPAAAQTYQIGPATPPAGGGLGATVLREPAALFRANCATCHGPQGGGGRVSWVDGTPAPIIAGRHAPHVVSAVRAGRPPSMPAFPRQAITDEELAALALYVSQLPGSFRAPPAYAATVEILDEDPWFAPMQITVQPGDTVRFLNRGSTYHPVLSEERMMGNPRAGFDSGPLGPGGAFFMRFEQPGQQNVYCGVHPYMRGEVHVGQGFTPPSPSLSAPAPPPAVPGVGEIWVCAQFQDWPGKATDGVLQVIDPATWTVTHLIPVGNNPHNLWFGAGGAEAAVTNWFDVTISRVDAVTKTVIAADCVGGAAPAHITSDYDGRHWYATIEGSNYVHRFTQAPGPDALCGGGSIAPRLGWLGGYGPHGIWYTQGRLVVSNSMDSTFSVLDARTGAELALLPSGHMPMGASADRFGRHAAAGCMMGVSFYDLATLARVRDVPAMGAIIQALFTPDGRYVVAAGGGGVTVMDVARAVDPIGWPNPMDAIVAMIPTGQGAHGVAFGKKSGGGLYAYVTHKFENYVSVVDLGALAKAGDVPLTTSTTGKIALAGCTDTGGNGIAVRPNPAPWR